LLMTGISFISDIMSKSHLFIILFLLSIPALNSHAQDDKLTERARLELESRGEVYFCFVFQESFSTEYLSELISIAGFDNDTVFAYANKEQFNRFLQLNVPFDLLIPPSLLYKPHRTFKTTLGEIRETYPTYQQYVTLMQQFAQDFSDQCLLVEIGESVGGKKILAVKISDNVNTDESEPEVFYTSTIHGDEPSGYVLMLRLIDYILNNYNSDSRVTYLVDNAEIFINPLANPDGLYFLSDTSVFGARRFNLNNVDLNRNFPDVVAGPGEVIQPETQGMINFMSQRNIILSANFHDGAEVVNYPWDVWPKKHPDDEWYIRLSRQYADTAQKYSISGYMDDLNNGITNGYEWYQITGGRQDYVNYYLHGREVTIELSKGRFPDSAALEDLWQFNKIALVDYPYNCFTGIKGTVTDSITGKPLKARVFINDHDYDNSYVFSDKKSGTFYRMISGGCYHLSVSSDGYQTKDLLVDAPDNSQVEINIELKPVNTNLLVYPNPFADIIKILLNDSFSGEVKIEIFDASGILFINRRYEPVYPCVIEIDAGLLNPGFYILKVTGNNIQQQVKISRLP
jgi:hypothetical protein